METILLIIVGGIVTALTQLAKKWNIKTNYVLVGVSIICGATYYFAKEFLPQAAWEQIVHSIAGVLGVAVLIYNTLIKTSK